MIEWERASYGIPKLALKKEENCLKYSQKKNNKNRSHV